MSIRTLVEVNHDRLSDIKKNPKEFVDAMLHAIEAGGTYEQMNNDDGYAGDSHSRFWSKGGAVKYSRHHSGKCPTEMGDKPYVAL